MSKQYTIERHTHGWLVMGAIPIDEFGTVCALASKSAVVHPGIANYYGASVAFGTPGEMDLWKREIEDSIKTFNPQERFLAGTDTGMSSLTIFAALTDSVPMRLRAESRLGVDHGYTPRDSDDLGRCIRLLDMVPGWRERMAEVAVKFPNWAKVVEEWPRLERLYRSKDHGAVYVILRKCP